MALDPTKPPLRQSDRVEELRGEVHALKGAMAVLIAHVALLSRAPAAKREEILGNLGAMLPAALAQIEHDATPAAAAGFERAIESVAQMARHAIQFEPLPPSGRRDPDR